MNLRIILAAALLLASGMTHAAVVINEIYQRSRASLYYNQWVELYNCDDTPADIAGYKLSTNHADTNGRSIIPWGAKSTAFTNIAAGIITNTTVIPAHGYAVILDSGYRCEDTIDIPSGTVLLTVNAASLVEGSTYISSEKCVVLKTPAGVIADSYGTPGIPDAIPDYGIRYGISTERINPYACDSVSNWGSSTAAPSGSTPGCSNALTASLTQGAAVIFALRFPEITPTAGIPFPVEVFAMNTAGTYDPGYSGRVTVSIRDDIDIMHYQKLQNYSKSDYTISMDISGGRSGIFYFRTRHTGPHRASVTGDRLPALATEFSVKGNIGHGSGTIYFSEIMYINDSFRILAPAGISNRYTEWIELHNTGSTPFVVSSCKLHKWSESSPNSSIYDIPFCVIPANGFCVIARSSNDFRNVYGNLSSPLMTVITCDFGGLAQEQTLALVDASGNSIDTAAYSRDTYITAVTRCGTKNGIPATITNNDFISMERISYRRPALMKENWGNARTASPVSYTASETESGIRITNVYTSQLYATPGASNSISLVSPGTLAVTIPRAKYVFTRGQGPLTIPFTVTGTATCDVRVFTKNGRCLGAVAQALSPAGNTPASVTFNGAVGTQVLKPDLYYFQISAVDAVAGASSFARYYFAVRD
ncbi:MAG: lamin tail domain-containing protein [Spirochaetes bacterium]|nr:lamin tail domain-containing protein [Spirochaetota bacterium]